jgi:DNA polymerase III alpha subunit
MKTNCHGQMIFDEADLVNQLMQGNQQFADYTVDSSVNLSAAVDILENIPSFINYNSSVENISTEQFDLQCQQNWHMPEEYKTLDIAELILTWCNNDGELQRCGQELLLYQERNLFDLLRYLKYLVDTMTQNQVIWGVGRGSSVASYVLYKLGVHRINSLYYNLDVAEFLR